MCVVSTGNWLASNCCVWACNKQVTAHSLTQLDTELFVAEPEHILTALLSPRLSMMPQHPGNRYSTSPSQPCNCRSRCVAPHDRLKTFPRDGATTASASMLRACLQLQSPLAGQVG